MHQQQEQQQQPHIVDVDNDFDLDGLFDDDENEEYNDGEDNFTHGAAIADNHISMVSSTAPTTLELRESISSPSSSSSSSSTTSSRHVVSSDSVSSLSSTSSLSGHEDQHEQQYNVHQQQQQQQPLMTMPMMMMTPPLTTDENFVNVYIVFDPRSGGSFLCPEQVLSFRNHTTGDVSTVVIGPSAVMNDAQLDAIFQVSTSSNNNINNSTSPTTLADTATPAAAHEAPEEEALPIPTTAPSTVVISAKPAIVTSTGDLPPLRALSAYNFFFRDERNRILHEDDDSASTEQPDESGWSPVKQQQLLHEHWGRDRLQKRRHRKTHGKIDFTTLSRLISSRWKKLPASRKDFYRQVAAMDFERYQNETMCGAVKPQQPQQPTPLTTTSSSSIQKFHPVVG
jgi:hypothetical protein